MFREIREIKKKERISNDTISREKESDGFRSIRPETDMTVKDAINFINTLFSIEEENR